MSEEEEETPGHLKRVTQYIIYCKSCGYSEAPVYEEPLKDDTGLCSVCCMAKLTVTTETFLRPLTKTEQEFRTLTALKNELVQMFGWTDTSSLHALLHVRSAIYHFTEQRKKNNE